MSAQNYDPAFGPQPMVVIRNGGRYWSHTTLRGMWARLLFGCSENKTMNLGVPLP
jgi:hypothetical protein